MGGARLVLGLLVGAAVLGTDQGTVHADTKPEESTWPRPGPGQDPVDLEPRPAHLGQPNFRPAACSR